MLTLTIRKKMNLLNEHDNDISTAAGILMFCPATSRFLVQMRSDKVSSYPHTISVPGGHLTRGELPSEGAWREFREESGYLGPSTELSLIEKTSAKVDFYLYFAVVDQEFQAKPFPEFAHEVVWSRWMSKKELLARKDLHPGFRDSLENSNILSEQMEVS